MFTIVYFRNIKKVHYLFKHYFALLKKNGQPRWPIICQLLLQLKRKCDNNTATVESLKVIDLNE